MEGEITTPVIGGYFVMMMDAMVAPMYDDGLANIKKVAEAEASAAEPPNDNGGDAPEDTGDGA